MWPISKAHDIHAELAAVLDVLLRDVGFRVGRNAHRRGAGGMGASNPDGADAGSSSTVTPRASHLRMPGSIQSRSVCALKP